MRLLPALSLALFSCVLGCGSFEEVVAAEGPSDGGVSMDAGADASDGSVVGPPPPGCNDRDNDNAIVLKPAQEKCDAADLRAQGTSASRTKRAASHCEGGVRHYECLFENLSAIKATDVAATCGRWFANGAATAGYVRGASGGNWPAIERLSSATVKRDRWAIESGTTVKRYDDKGKFTGGGTDTLAICSFPVTVP
jgi:hypothetical protein